MKKNFLKIQSLFSYIKQVPYQVKSFFRATTPEEIIFRDVFFVSVILSLFLTLLSRNQPPSAKLISGITTFFLGISFFFLFFKIKTQKLVHITLITLSFLIFRNLFLIFYKFFLNKDFYFFREFINLNVYLKNNQLFLFTFLSILLFIFLIKTKSKKTNAPLALQSATLKEIVLPIFIGFMAIRLFMIFNYSGNFADDWQHIIAGMDFFKTGELNRTSQQFENGYLRGSFMSILTGLFIFIFGKNLIAAKMAPLLIGIFNFSLLFSIAKKFFQTKRWLTVLLLFYSFYPLVVFNHIYIRTYVFFEFFALIIIYSLIKLKLSLEKSSLKKSIFPLLNITAVNYLAWFWSYDQSRYTTLFLTLIGLAYLIFFDLEKIKTSQQGFWKIITATTKKQKIFLLIALITLAELFFIDFQDLFRWARSATAPSRRHDQAYFNFLVSNHFVLSSFLVASVYIFFKKRESSKSLITFCTIALVSIHILLNENAQIIRGFMYLLPLIFLTSFLVIESFSLKTKKPIIEILIGLCLLLTLIYNYPNNFFKVGPEIPFEVGYADYNKTYQYIKNNLSDRKILQADYNIMAELFFDVKTSYKLGLKNRLYHGRTHEYDERSARTLQIATKTPLITSEKEFYKFVSENNTCIIIRPVSRESFFTEQSWSYFEEHFKKEADFNAFSIYCE